MPSDSTLGSKNYDKTPGAILLGAGYSDQEIEGIRRVSAGIKDVPWLKPNTNKPAPPLGPEYGKALVARIKETVKELSDMGRMTQDAVVWY